MIEFRSDNTGMAHPAILEALVRANQGAVLGYGGDDGTARLKQRFSELFETEVDVFPVATGTAANALSVAAITPSWGACYCSTAAHIETSECNASVFFSGGAKLALVEGSYGKVDPVALEAALAGSGKGAQHKMQPSALNIVQATDRGAVYRPAEVAALGDIARAHGLTVQMDGARFANALAATGATPAEMTWKSGVDVLSFGCTKNGGMLTDAIVTFKPEVAKALWHQVRRAGLVWSKMRYASAQLESYVEDGLWLKLAAQSNAAGARLGAALGKLPGVKLLAPVDANMLFVEAPAHVLDAVAADGLLYYRQGATLARFVCRWDVTQGETEALVASFAKHTATAKAA